MGTCYRYRHSVDEGWFRGGVAGAEPPHKGGPNRPDRPELQWSVVSGRVLAALDLIAEWAWFGLGHRYTIGSPGLPAPWRLARGASCDLPIAVMVGASCTGQAANDLRFFPCPAGSIGRTAFRELLRHEDGGLTGRSQTRLDRGQAHAPRSLRSCIFFIRRGSAVSNSRSETSLPVFFDHFSEYHLLKLAMWSISHCMRGAVRIIQAI